MHKLQRLPLPLAPPLAHRATLRLGVLCGILTGGIAPAVQAEPMLDSIRAGWSTYIFVSTTMPNESLAELAREAGKADAVLVFRGFSLAGQQRGSAVDLQAMQVRIHEIDVECCTGKGVTSPRWMIDPRLFDRYHVRAAPSFVVAWGTQARPQDYSMVAGDMALANALKFMAQGSQIAGIRTRAGAIYRAAYGGQL